jgi:hypothetical protein
MTLDANMTAVLVVLALLLVVAAVLHFRRQQSHTLEKHFGPEYERAVHEHGNRSKAEAELLARQKRVKSLNIAPLSPQEASRFADAWRAVQARFVDNPTGSLAEADRLVCDLMQKRGYPMGDFERNAADISVDHPAVVDHYRAAHDIAMREQRGGVDTESMRQAIIHYRALFSEVLEVEEPRDMRDERREGRHSMRTQS